MKLYDKNVVAKFLDMTPKNVEKLTEKGVLRTKQGSLYSLIESVNDYIRYLRERSPESEENLNLGEERARLIRTKRLNEEIELEIKKGELHRGEDIEKVVSATLVNFKNRLEAIPAGEAGKLAEMTDKAKIFKHLNGKIKEALCELSDFQGVFKKELEMEEEDEETYD